MPISSRRWPRVLGVLVALTLPTAAHAQDSPAVASATHHESTLVRIDASDLVVDAGSRTGAHADMRFALYRPITVRHPVTGRPLRDRFRIGTVRLRTVGDVLSLAVIEGSVTRTPEIGDILVPDAPIVARFQPAAPSVDRTSSPAPHDEDESPTPHRVEAPGANAEERAAIGAWLATLGRQPSERIGYYRGYLREYPSSPFASTVQREIAWLTSQLASDAERHRALESEVDRLRALVPTAPTAAHDTLPTSVRIGDPVVIALQISQETATVPVILHARRRGEQAYRSMQLAVDDEAYVRGEVPTELIAPPGLEYFVEFVRTDGTTVPVVGSSDRPVNVTVEPLPAPPVTVAGRTRIDLRGEYADVGSIANRPEYFTHIEADFLQRVRWSVLYGYRVGFGVYEGVGQPLCAYDNRCASTPPTFAVVVYGYHELEFAVTDFFHVITRLEAGVRRDGLAAGIAARARVGRELGTNILFGGDILMGVGQHAFFAFNFFPIRPLSLTAQAEVFNQDIDGGDPMFRFVGQAGIRVLPWLTLSARGSYQLRNIAHGGFGGGGALTFDY